MADIHEKVLAWKPLGPQLDREKIHVRKISDETIAKANERLEALSEYDTAGLVITELSSGSIILGK